LNAVQLIRVNSCNSWTASANDEVIQARFILY